MTDKLNPEAYLKAMNISAELVEVPEEHSLGCSIDKVELERVLTKYEVDISDGSMLHAIMLGKIFAVEKCTYNRVVDIGHYFYHLFNGEAPDLAEILADDDIDHETVIRGSDDTVH